MNIKNRIIGKLSELKKPLMDIELAKIFEIEKNQYDDFFAMLEEMEREGKLIVTKKKKYALPETFNMKRGKIQGTQKGFGFFIPEDESDDIFISPKNLMGAMNGDIVLISSVDSSEGGKREEGRVEKIVMRANDQIVGTYQKNDSFGFVIADDKKIVDDIYIAHGKDLNGKNR